MMRENRRPAPLIAQLLLPITYSLGVLRVYLITLSRKTVAKQLGLMYR